MMLSAFDLDRTLIRGNSSLDFCRFLVKKKVLPVSALFFSGFYFLKHQFFNMSITELHHAVFDRFLQGIYLDHIEEHVEDFMKSFLFRAFYPPVLSNLKLAQHMGHYTVILSNSPSFLVKAIAQFLKVNEWKATEYSVDTQKRLSAITNLIQGKDKARHLKEIANKLGIFQKDMTAYSDSFHDLEFLKSAGNPVAVNPDKKLRAFSVKNEWNIL